MWFFCDCCFMCDCLHYPTPVIPKTENRARSIIAAARVRQCRKIEKPKADLNRRPSHHAGGAAVVRAHLHKRHDIKARVRLIVENQRAGQTYRKPTCGSDLVGNQRATMPCSGVSLVLDELHQVPQVLYLSRPSFSFKHRMRACA